MILRDAPESEAPKDPSKDHIASKGSPGTGQRSMVKQRPIPVVHHHALE